MEIVINTDYQDIYRVAGGVLLVVNKFEYDKSYGGHCCVWGGKQKPYHKQTKALRVLKEDVVQKGYNAETSGYDVTHIIPEGTVLKHSHPIRLADKSKWTYEIKTTGDCFSGSCEEILEYIDEIKKTIIG